MVAFWHPSGLNSNRRHNKLDHLVTPSKIKMSKPVLYTFPHAVWPSAPTLALAELGIDADLSHLNLFEGENFRPEFLKLNPNATLPTLTHGEKSYTSTAEVINYLVSISSTKVAPETSITTTVHEAKIDPNSAILSARNDEELTKLSGGFANVYTTTRLEYLKKHAAAPEAKVHKRFYDKKITAISELHALLNWQASDEAKRDFFSTSTALWESIKAFVLETLPAAIAEGPFIGGDRPGVDDFHVGAWLARIASVLGAQNSDAGVATLEKAFGPLPEKVKAYWSAWIVRDSWVKAYPDNVLH